VRSRVFIIVDNLDKAWDKGADIAQLSRLILALLACMDAFRHDLESDGSGTPVSLSLFIRNDIYVSVAGLSREPDKLPVRRITWASEGPLIEILDYRYAASRERAVTHDELWDRYFCESMSGRPPKVWLVETCLPRPRDVLYLCRAAIDQAVGRRHARVEPDDLGSAERQYSLFAFEAAAVEAQQRVRNIEDVLLEFAGASTELAQGHLADLLRSAGVDAEGAELVLDALMDVSFLGFLTSDGPLYPDSPREKQLARILARRFAQKSGAELRYVVHPAFWAYLEMERGDHLMSLGV
jgi:hypothetical protein